MNMMAFEFDDDVVIVDCGVMFPDAELLGVDIVVPDLTYVRENRERIRAILLTHGHEDHIGGLPYLLEEVEAPVYGTPFTLALAQSNWRTRSFLTSLTARYEADRTTASRLLRRAGLLAWPIPRGIVSSI